MSFVISSPNFLFHHHLDLLNNHRSKRLAIRLREKEPKPIIKRTSRILCSKPNHEISQQRKQWRIFQSWDVPWDWKTILYVMMPYLMSIAFSGILGSTMITGISEQHYDSLQSTMQNTDEVATQMLLDQLLKTVVKLSVLYAFVSPYQPFPDNIFSYRWHEPFNLQAGWILWGMGGLITASIAVFLIMAFSSTSSTGQMQNQVDYLVRLLPLIGASKTSTLSLLGILGVIAPFWEETLYRGFLFTSLTKWLPVHVSVAVSAAVFTLAHLSPGKSLEIFTFGVTLGLVYAQTRNLLAPMAMHACWNLGVILMLTYLQSQGYDIGKYVL